MRGQSMQGLDDPLSGLLELIAWRGGGRRGAGGADRAVAWAQSAVDAGWDAQSVFMLAGCLPPFDCGETDPLIVRLLDELEVPEPSPDSIVDALARHLCERILDGSMMPAEASGRLSALSFDHGCPARLQRWRLIEDDVGSIEAGYGPVHHLELSEPDLARFIREAAAATLREIPEPAWLTRLRAVSGPAVRDLR